MSWHGYVLVYDIPPGWLKGDDKRSKAWGALKGIGRQIDPQPAKMNHTRERLDQRALLIEAEFEEAEITRGAIVATMADAVGLPPAAVDAVIDYMIFDEVLTWEESNALAKQYLIDNATDWEPPVEEPEVES